MEPAQAERGMNKIPSRVEDVAMDARTRLNETVSQVGTRARDAMRYADQTVHSNPWTAVGIGFGAGVVFGALLAMAIGSQRSMISRL
ncbi:MAG TPA: hypothetical protein VEB41_01130 [Burkholderiales bacterium]|nr:hypothetical protein [Burkholderiales bacterium]